MTVPENEDSLELFGKFRELDEILSSDATKKNFFGSKASKYSYIPIVRDGKEDKEGNKDLIM